MPFCCFFTVDPKKRFSIQICKKNEDQKNQNSIPIWNERKTFWFQYIKIEPISLDYNDNSSDFDTFIIERSTSHI